MCFALFINIGETRRGTIMWDFLKHRLVSVTATVTMIGTIVGSAIAVESRYAKAADVDDMKRQQVIIYQNLQQEQRLAMDDFRRHELEDRLFELRLKNS